MSSIASSRVSSRASSRGSVASSVASRDSFSRGSQASHVPSSRASSRASSRVSSFSSSRHGGSSVGRSEFSYEVIDKNLDLSDGDIENAGAHNAAASRSGGSVTSSHHGEEEKHATADDDDKASVAASDASSMTHYSDINPDMFKKEHKLADQSYKLWHRINPGFMNEPMAYKSMSQSDFSFDDVREDEMEYPSVEFHHRGDGFTEFVEAKAKYELLQKSTNANPHKK